MTQQEKQERELVAGCLRNDRRCQEQFYRRFAPVMLRMCQRYTSEREEALEIVNAGLLRVFQKLDSYAFRGSLEGWVRRVVFHALADHFRRSDRKVKFLELADRDRPEAPEVLHHLYLNDIYSLLDQLPPVSKEVFWLYAVEGYTHREIGQRLNMSDGTSKWHLSTARHKLRKMVEKLHHTNQTDYAG